MSNLFDSGIRPAVDDWLLQKAQEKRDYGDYWSASSAGYCQRKVIFERLGVPHVEKDDDARKQRVFTAGHLFHDWIQGITKAAGLSIASEVELQDEDLMVRGHFDDLILIEDPNPQFDGVDDKGENLTHDEPKVNLILYDYKTRNSRNFDYAKRPSYFHRLQLGTYMYMLRKLADEDIKPFATSSTKEGEQAAKRYFDGMKMTKDLTEARILNIEKDTLRMAEVQYLWDAQLEKDVLDYWNSLNAAYRSRKLPKCTCADHEGGFMAKEKWNPYWFEGESCSIKLYEKWKKEKVAV